MHFRCLQVRLTFFQNLPYECTAKVPNENKDVDFWLSAHIVRAYPYMEITNTRMSKWQVAACSVLSPSKSYIIELRRFWLSAYSDPAEKFSPPALN